MYIQKTPKKMTKIIMIVFLYIFLFSSPLFVAESAAEEIQGKKVIAANVNGDIVRTNEDNKAVFNFILENDLFGGEDRAYTNGIRFSYSSKEETSPNWLRRSSRYLPLLNKEGKKRINFAIGQNMFTPSNIDKSEFIENDFLYAGWLYGLIGITSDMGSKFDNVALAVGVIGPSSKAEQSQKFVHDVTGANDPKGWDNQLKDEFGINLAYERRWREIFAANPFAHTSFDVMPHIGINLGNVATDASIGATFRFGKDLPADYGPPRIRPFLFGSDFFIPTQKISGYVFSIVEARAVGHNIFLDGNTFGDGPKLDKRTFVKSAQVGAALVYKDSRLSYSHVFMSKEFKGQKGTTQFGGITFSYRF